MEQSNSWFTSFETDLIENETIDSSSLVDNIFDFSWTNDIWTEFENSIDTSYLPSWEFDYNYYQTYYWNTPISTEVQVDDIFDFFGDSSYSFDLDSFDIDQWFSNIDYGNTYWL